MCLVSLDEPQAKKFARLIYMDIKKYVQDHPEEYEAFLKELESEEGGKRSKE